MSDAIDGVEKPKRVLELELRIESDKYDTDAWSELLRRAGSVVQVSTSAGPVPQATLDGAYASYDAFLAVFPTSGRHWRNYVDTCLGAGDDKKAKEVLQRAIEADITDVDLWLTYVRFVVDKNLKPCEERIEAAASTKVEETKAWTDYRAARVTVTKAFEFALSVMEFSYTSGPLWKEFAAFIKKNPDTETFWVRGKNEALRKLYERAVLVATPQLEELWRDFCDFEKTLTTPQTASYLSKQHSNFATSLAALKEKRAIWGQLTLDMLAKPPHHVPAGVSDEVAKARKARTDEQVALWLRAIAVEKRNPHHVDDAQLLERVRLVYRQCLSCLRYYPDIWMSWIYFENASHKPEKVDACVQSALKVLPESQLLALAIADMLEINKAYDRAEQVYESILASNPSALVYIRYMMFARRIHGMAKARDVFKRARTSPQCSPELFLASGQMELYANRTGDIARRVLDLGRKTYPENVGYAMAMLDMLIPTADESNTRVLFQSILESLPSAASAPVWDRFLEFEASQVMGYGGESGLLNLTALEARRSAVHPETGSCAQLSAAMHRYHAFGLAPSSKEDQEYFRRNPWRGAASASAFSALAAVSSAAAGGSGAVAGDEPSRGSAGVAASASAPSSSGPSDPVEPPAFLKRLMSLLPKQYVGPRNKPDFVIKRVKTTVVPQPAVGLPHSSSGAVKRSAEDGDDRPPSPPRTMPRYG